MANRTELQSAMTNVVANVLGLSPTHLTPDVNLFECGLDSITAIQIVVGLTKQYNVQITPVDIFRNQTIESLAEVILQRMQGIGADYQKTFEPPH